MNPNDEQELPQVGSQEILRETVLNEKFPLQTFEFGKGKLRVRDLVPENMREGGDVPIALWAGWGMRQDVVGNTTQGLYDLGQRVMPIDLEGGAKGIVGRIQSEIDRQADVVYEWVKSNPDQKYKFAPQSMATLALLSLVERHPDIKDQIEGVVFLSPMGLAGDPGEHDLSVSDPAYNEQLQQKSKSFKDKIVGSVTRLGGKNMQNLLQRKSAEDVRNNERNKTDEDKQIESRVWDSLKSSAKHPGRMVREAFEMAGADEYQALHKLQEMGIKVGIIQGAQDRLNSSQGLVENISRQALDNNEAHEFTDEKGIEKLPDELVIQVDDSPEVVVDKQKKIIEYKIELQKVSNPVPVDSLVIVEGGHEITGPYGFAKDILRSFDYLEHPEQYRETLDENLRRNEELNRLHAEEEQMEIQQQANDEEELKKAREELAHLNPENQIQ